MRRVLSPGWNSSYSNADNGRYVRSSRDSTNGTTSVDALAPVPEATCARARRLSARGAPLQHLGELRQVVELEVWLRFVSIRLLQVRPRSAAQPPRP